MQQRWVIIIIKLMNTLSKAFFLSGITLAASVVLNGAHFAYDGFSTEDYIDDAILQGQNGGTIDGNPGWAREILGGSRVKAVHANGLEYLNLMTTPGGTGGIFYDGSGFDGGFTRNALYAPGPDKPGVVDSVLYGSMLLKFGDPVEGAPVIPGFFGYEADGVDITNGFNTSIAQIRNSSPTELDQLRLMIPKGNEVDRTTNLDLTQTILIVFEMSCFQTEELVNELKIWFNPTDLSDVPGTAVDMLSITEAELGTKFLTGWAYQSVAGVYFKSGMRDNRLDEIRLAWGDGASLADVLPVEAAADWYGYPVGEMDWVDTSPWLKRVNITLDPWIWAEALEKYVYLQDDSGWVYVPKP